MNKRICPVCKTEISKKWMFWGGYGKYVCTNCNSALCLTRSKKVKNSAAIVLDAFITVFAVSPLLSKQLGMPFYIKGLIAGAFAFVICLILIFVMDLIFKNDIKVEINGDD